jgi:hypothetical protein
MKALAAEMAATFSKKLAPFKMIVKELTGDMQLTKAEIMETSMIITTPEKWDVVTRKPGKELDLFTNAMSSTRLCFIPAPKIIDVMIFVFSVRFQFSVSASCFTISNLDLLSSSETGVNAMIRS